MIHQPVPKYGHAEDRIIGFRRLIRRRSRDFEVQAGIRGAAQAPQRRPARHEGRRLDIIFVYIGADRISADHADKLLRLSPEFQPLMARQGDRLRRGRTD
ncbi:MAG: hypothetical protein B7Z30_17550 [Rhizobiales bacterium 12-68-15]|nr:MAG: hypothetical protein B7Z30_17550 [Rhizobiales bacterium 12-68-15]